MTEQSNAVSNVLPTQSARTWHCSFSVRHGWMPTVACEAIACAKAADLTWPLISANQIVASAKLVRSTNVAAVGDSGLWNCASRFSRRTLSAPLSVPPPPLPSSSVPLSCLITESWRTSPPPRQSGWAALASAAARTCCRPITAPNPFPPYPRRGNPATRSSPSFLEPRKVGRALGVAVVGGYVLYLSTCNRSI